MWDIWCAPRLAYVPCALFIVYFERDGRRGPHLAPTDNEASQAQRPKQSKGELEIVGRRLNRQGGRVNKADKHALVSAGRCRGGKDPKRGKV
jgi:hypothetical protein